MENPTLTGEREYDLPNQTEVSGNETNNDRRSGRSSVRREDRRYHPDDESSDGGESNGSMRQRNIPSTRGSRAKDLMPQIPVYSGTFAEFACFSAACNDAIMLLAPGEEIYFLRQLSQRLTGGAKMLYEHKLRRYTSIKEMLKDMGAGFRSFDDISSWLVRMQQTIHKPGESALEYGGRCVQLMGTGILCIENDTSLGPGEKANLIKHLERAALDNFLRGLYRPLRTEVLYDKPNTIEQAVNLARQLEDHLFYGLAYKNHLREGIVLQKVPQGENRKVYYTDTLSEDVHVMKTEAVSDNSISLVPFNKETTSATQRQPEPSSSKTDERKAGTFNRKSQSLMCSYCKRKNHTEDRCWKKHGPPTCNKCNEKGHLAKSCRSEERQRSQMVQTSLENTSAPQPPPKNELAARVAQMDSGRPVEITNFWEYAEQL